MATATRLTVEMIPLTLTAFTMAPAPPFAMAPKIATPIAPAACRVVLRMAEAVPLLEQRVQSDAEQAAVATHRVRLGLFTYHQDPTQTPGASGSGDAVPRRLPKGK